MRFRWKADDELDLNIVGKAPNGRYDHGMQQFKNTIIIFGGRKINRDDPFSTSIYILQLQQLTWIRL